MRDMKAAELMTPDAVVVDASTPIPEVAERLRDHDIGSVPVVQDRRSKRLLGVITDRDIAVRCIADGHDPRSCTAERHMTRDVRAARAGDDVGRVMQLMRAEQVRRIPVVDDNGRVLGVIAQADLAVEAADEETVSRLDVADVLEKISEPAHPERKSANPGG